MALAIPGVKLNLGYSILEPSFTKRGFLRIPAAHDNSRSHRSVRRRQPLADPAVPPYHPLM